MFPRSALSDRNEACASRRSSRATGNFDWTAVKQHHRRCAQLMTPTVDAVSIWHPRQPSVSPLLPLRAPLALAANAGSAVAPRCGCGTSHPSHLAQPLSQHTHGHLQLLPPPEHEPSLAGPRSRGGHDMCVAMVMQAACRVIRRRGSLPPSLTRSLPPSLTRTLPRHASCVWVLTPSHACPSTSSTGAHHDGASGKG